MTPKIVIVTAVAAALVPTTANARFDLNPPPVHRTASRAPAIVAPRSPAASQPGFHWGDAGAGAGAMLALVGVAGATAVTTRRRRGHRPTTS